MVKDPARFFQTVLFGFSVDEGDLDPTTPNYSANLLHRRQLILRRATAIRRVSLLITTVAVGGILVLSLIIHQYLLNGRAETEFLRYVLIGLGGFLGFIATIFFMLFY